MPNNTSFAPDSIAQFTNKAVHFNGLSVSGVAIKATQTNVDLKLSDDHLITGGVFMCKGGIWGDTVVVQVVDVDDIYGLGPGTVLNQFINWFLPDSPGEGVQLELKVDYPAKIPAGLYLRMIYTSIGTSDVQVAVNYMLHTIII